MVDIEALIQRKTADRASKQEENRKAREDLSETRGIMIDAITTEPETYLKYLDLQAINPRCSVGNVALSMIQLQSRNPSYLGTEQQWRAQGRYVSAEERDNGAGVFVPGKEGRGYFMGKYYDVSQTTGRPLKEPLDITKNPENMTKALEALISSAPVDVDVDKELDCPAYYDPEGFTIQVNTNYEEPAIFAALIDEVALAKFHGRGYIEDFSREGYQLDAQSVGYMVCRRFGVEHEKPNADGVGKLYSGYDTDQRERMLNSIHKKSQEIGRNIEDMTQPRHREQAQSHRRQPVR